MPGVEERFRTTREPGSRALVSRSALAAASPIRIAPRHDDEYAAITGDSAATRPPPPGVGRATMSPIPQQSSHLHVSDMAALAAVRIADALAEG
jgi:hypothetical protein